MSNVEKLPDELLEKLPEEVVEMFSIAERSARYQVGNRTPTLGWLANVCAEYGLTDGQIVQVIQYRNGLWRGQAKLGGSLYHQYAMYVRLVDKAREKFPKAPGAGAFDDFTEEAP